MQKRNLWLIIGALVVIAVIIIGIRLARKPTPREQVIKIGAILPLTGPASSFGQYVKEGIDLSVEEINKKNTPFKFHIIYEDSKNQPKEAVAAYNKMLAIEKPYVVIAALSSVASALAPLAPKNKTVLLFVDVAKPGVADGIFSFRLYPEASGTAGVISRFAALYLRAKRAGVIYINDDYGLASLKVFTKKFQSLGGKVIFTESYMLTQKDFKDIMIKLKNINPPPDVVYLNGYGPAFVKAVRQYREIGVQATLVADVAMGLPENLSQAGNAAEGVYFVDAEISPSFINLFRQRYGKDPSSDAAYAYDAIRILYKIRKEIPEWKPDYIRKALKKIKNFPGVTGPITFKPSGDAQLHFIVKKVINGKPVKVEWR